MKNAVILIVALIILCTSGIWQIKYIEESSIYAISDVEYAANLVQNDDFAAANLHIKELEKTWGSMKTIWTIFITHNEIDYIETALTNLKMYIKLENKEEAIVYAEILKQNFQHVTRKQKITIENIF